MSQTTIGGESIRQVTSGHQSRLILAVVCAASVMCATSARAQAPPVSKSQNTAPQDSTWNDTNPCNGMSVAFQGHSSLKEVFGSDGDYTARIQQDGKSTASGDNAQYQFNYWTDVRIRSSTPNYKMTFQSNKHIIRQGPPVAPNTKDDWFVQESVTFSPLSPPSRNSDKSEATCK